MTIIQQTNPIARERWRQFGKRWHTANKRYQWFSYRLMVFGEIREADVSKIYLIPGMEPSKWLTTFAEKFRSNEL